MYGPYPPCPDMIFGEALIGWNREVSNPSIDIPMALRLFEQLTAPAVSHQDKWTRMETIEKLFYRYYQDDEKQRFFTKDDSVWENSPFKKWVISQIDGIKESIEHNDNFYKDIVLPEKKYFFDIRPNATRYDSMYTATGKELALRNFNEAVLTANKFYLKLLSCLEQLLYSYTKQLFPLKLYAIVGHLFHVYIRVVVDFFKPWHAKLLERAPILQFGNDIFDSTVVGVEQKIKIKRQFIEGVFHKIFNDEKQTVTRYDKEHLLFKDSYRHQLESEFLDDPSIPGLGLYMYNDTIDKSISTALYYPFSKYYIQHINNLGSNDVNWVLPDHVLVTQRAKYMQMLIDIDEPEPEPEMFLYVAHVANYSIKKFDMDGNFILQFGEAGTGDGQFQYSNRLAIDSEGNIYVSDKSKKCIQKFDLEGNFILKWGNTTYNDIAIDSMDNIFALSNKAIDKFDTEGNLLFQFETFETGYSWIMSIDKNDYIHVHSAAQPVFENGSNSVVKKFDSTGNVISEIELNAFEMEFSSMVTDSNNNLYVATAGQLRKYDSSGNKIFELYNSRYGSGRQGPGQFGGPFGMVIDNHDNIFICCSESNRIQIFNTNGDFIKLFTTVDNPIYIEGLGIS